MAEKKTLLDLDRLPTLEEMQDFFKENDWSASYSQAVRMHKAINEGTLDKDFIIEIMSEEKANQRETYRISAETVRYIFKLFIEGLGPNLIAKRLRDEKYVTPTEYYYFENRSASNPRPIDPYGWDQTAIRYILDNRQYTGCTVNAKSSIVSYKVHKKIEFDESEWQIIPNTQEAIIDEETFNIAHEMRQSRRRNTATGRKSMFRLLFTFVR